MANNNIEQRIQYRKGSNGDKPTGLKDLKVLPPDHPIYKGGFKTYPVNSSKNKKLHLTEVRSGMSEEQIKKNLLKTLKKNGIEVKDDK